MMHIKTACSVSALLLLSCGTAPAQDLPGLTLGPDGTVLLRGQEVRSVGVNYFNAFYRNVIDKDNLTYREGLDELARRGIPFIRFNMGGFWPSEWALYNDDADEYFRRLDAFVAYAEQKDIGLIPSLFWAYHTVPDLMGEPMRAWGDLDSKTIAFMRKYTAEVVARYKDSPAIWAWEFGNEHNLAADLPNAADHRPPTWETLGTPLTRTEADDMTHEQLVTATKAFGEAVRAIDSHRLITTGHSIPRPTAHHQRTELSWTQDTREQFAQNLIDVTPDPLQLVSIHIYNEQGQRFGEDNDLGETLRVAQEACKENGKALFVGEFGVSQEDFDGDAARIRARFEEQLRQFAEHNVPLAAVWNYDMMSPGQDIWDVWNNPDRRYMLDLVEKANNHGTPEGVPE